MAARESRLGSAASQSASLHFSLRSLVTTSLLLNNNKANHVCSRRSSHRAYSASLDGPASPRLGSSSHLRKLTLATTARSVCATIQKRGHVITFSLLALFSLIEWIIAAALVSYVSRLVSAAPTAFRFERHRLQPHFPAPFADPDGRPLQYNKDHNYPSNSVR